MPPLKIHSKASEEIHDQGELEQGELLTEISPGIFRPLVPRVDIPRYIVSKVMPNGDGTYRIEPVTQWQGWMKAVDIENDPNLPSISHITLRRLVKAGFIDGGQITPGLWYVRLDSLFEHVDRTTKASMDESWWTDERRRVFKEAR